MPQQLLLGGRGSDHGERRVRHRRPRPQGTRTLRWTASSARHRSTCLSGPDPSESDGRSTAVAIAYAGLTLGLLLAAFDETVLSTALPTIAGSLGHIERLSWITVYILAATLAAPVFGRLNDDYRSKTMFQLAIALFLVGSVLSGLAQTVGQLIVFRGHQGLGGEG